MTTILLIEDAVDLVNAIRREPESNGYRVRHAADGVTGLLLFKNKAPDLVILDWMLPKLSGLDVLREMRSQSAVQILMLTARHEEADRVIGLELGADDYLTKPFGMRELTARVSGRFHLSLLDEFDNFLAVCLGPPSRKIFMIPEQSHFEPFFNSLT